LNAEVGMGPPAHRGLAYAPAGRRKKEKVRRWEGEKVGKNQD